MIHNYDRIKQVHDFSGLEIGDKIRPSDIDYVLERNNNTLLIGEGKLIGMPLTMGQRLTIESIVNNYLSNGGRAFGCVYEHNVPHHESVMVARCQVRSIYVERQWKTVLKPYTMLELQKYVFNYR